jgi:hypothetical protein
MFHGQVPPERVWFIKSCDVCPLTVYGSSSAVMFPDQVAPECAHLGEGAVTQLTFIRLLSRVVSHVDGQVVGLVCEFLCACVRACVRVCGRAGMRA